MTLQDEDKIMELEYKADHAELEKKAMHCLTALQLRWCIQKTHVVVRKKEGCLFFPEWGYHISWR